MRPTLRGPARAALLVATVTLFALLPGCGGDGRVKLEGAVSYDGTPIDNGTITFVPAGGEDAKRPKASARITDGKYAFEADFGPMPGAHRVEVTWDKKTGKKVSTGDADMRDETKQVLPAKYNAQSTLTADLVRGETKKDFALTK